MNKRPLMQKRELNQLIRSRLDIWYFLTEFVKTSDREKGEQPFPDYPYLRSMVHHFVSEQRIVILKSRQMMVTWSSVAFSLWEAIFKGNAEILFLSKREDDAKEAIRRVKFIFDRLPGYMKPDVGENNRFTIEFPCRNSRLMALPTSPHIGRTYSPTRIIWDEMASTPFDEDIYAALQPALDGGGSFIGISTSQGPYTKHAELYQNAEAYGFAPVGLHYSEHPLKDETWQQNARRGMSDQQWQMEQEMSIELSGKRVYESFQRQTHEVAGFYPDRAGKLYRSIDFGFHTPVVIWAELRDKVLYIFGEWIGEQETVSDMARAIIDKDREFGLTEENFTVNYCDPAGAARTDIGISSLDRLKQEYFAMTDRELKISHRPSSIMAGVDLVREKLRNAAGEIHLKVSGSCSRTVTDFGRYIIKSGSNEPKKDGFADHTMDAIRYMVINLFQKKTSGRPLSFKPKIATILR